MHKYTHLATKAPMRKMVGEWEMWRAVVINCSCHIDKSDTKNILIKKTRAECSCKAFVVGGFAPFFCPVCFRGSWIVCEEELNYQFGLVFNAIRMQWALACRCFCPTVSNLRFSTVKNITAISDEFLNQNLGDFLQFYETHIAPPPYSLIKILHGDIHLTRHDPDFNERQASLLELKHFALWMD